MGTTVMPFERSSEATELQSPSATDLLRRAVKSKNISPREAELIISQAERRRGAGSDAARRYIDAAVVKLLAARERAPRKRAPRMTVYRATPKPPSFLVEVQKQLLEWALGECAELPTRDGVDEPALQRAVADFMADVRAAGTNLRHRLRSFSSVGVSAASSLVAINAALRELGLDIVRHARQIDVGEVRQAHRRLARMFHPDLNDGPEMRSRFERVQAAYERILEAVERAR
jgi:hypothetical protein